MTSPCNADPIRFLVWSNRRAAQKAIKKELDKVANNDSQRRKLEFVQGALKLKGKLIRFCNENSKKGLRDERLRAGDALLKEFAETEDVSRTSLRNMIRLIGIGLDLDLDRRRRANAEHAA